LNDQDNSLDRALTEEGENREKVPEEVTFEGIINMSSESISR
jgi:hypothetical protein